MNIFNLRPSVSPGISTYRDNELRINLPDAGGLIKIDQRRAFDYISVDMWALQQKHEAGEMNLNVGTQIVINEDQWPLAAWMINWFRSKGFEMIISVVTQMGISTFSLQDTS